MARDYVTRYRCDICGLESIDPSKFREIGMINAGDKCVNERFVEACLQCVPEVLGIEIDPGGTVYSTIPTTFFEEKN